MKISNRHRAFHFALWASKQRKPPTIRKIYGYMKENRMMASQWRARQFKDDWLAYLELKQRLDEQANPEKGTF
jgi:hypothetical protein